MSATTDAASTSVPGISPGALLDGKYLIGRIVGSGAFGLVFEGKNLELDEKVAIKTLRPEMVVDTAMVARFAREAKSAAAIKSEYVCSVYDVGVSPDGVPYIVMEFLEGRDLGTVLSEAGPLGPRTAVEYALQVCEALAVAHAKGIVHRDIKPENLLLTERAGGMRIIKVLDFGISKTALTGSIFGDELPIVKTVNLMGTPLYMSPEQVRSSGGVDLRSDIWSLGMVLYEILAGATAFEGNSITEICAAILESKPKPIELHRADLPSGLVEVISKCLEKDVTKRYQNVAELAVALMPFGPKRSRLNVERAVTILQSAGQVDPNLQIESIMPPPSSEISSSPLALPRPSRTGSEGSGVMAAPSSASPVVGAATIDDPARSTGDIASPSKKKPVVILASVAVIGGLAGAIFFLSGAGKAPPSETSASTAAAQPSTPPSDTQPPTAAAPPTSTTTNAPTAATEPPPTATTAEPSPPTTKATVTTPSVVRPSGGGGVVTHRAPKGGGGNTTNTATPATAAAPATTQAPSAPTPAPTPTETGRTFRREL